MKRLKQWILYGIYLAAVVVAVDYVFYRHYISQIFEELNIRVDDTQKPLPGNLTRLTMTRLGYVTADQKSHFVNFPIEKKEGVIRIGCFGDSYTKGDEVSENLDYPSLLQEILIRNGFDNIEVINFGGSWYGFAQTYTLWKELGRYYQLDIILIGPQCLNYYERSLSFNHAWRDSPEPGTLHPVYFHARYITSGDHLQLIDLVGETGNVRVKNYLRFFPPLRYIRFDINTPPFLSCLIPPGKRLSINPFYYRKDGLKKEVEQLYSLFLSDMAASSGSKVYVLQYNEEFAEMASRFQIPNYQAFRLHCPDHFPYKAIKGHNSPLGNAFLAQQVFHVLMNGEKFNGQVLQTHDIKNPDFFPPRLEGSHLQDYDDMSIELSGVDLGHFVYAYEKQTTEERVFILKEDGGKAILAIKERGQSVLDGIFLVLDTDLKKSTSLELSWETKGQTERLAVAPIRRLSSEPFLGVVDVLRIEEDSHRNGGAKIVFDDNVWSRLDEQAENISLNVNGQRILRAKGIDRENKGIFFRSEQKKIILAIPRGDLNIDITNLESSGYVYIVLSSGQEKVRIPCARWTKQWKTFPE